MRVLLITGILAAIGLSSGCATVTKSSDEVHATYRQILDIDTRQIGDDWNYLWLADRQYRLTRWHMR